jgi:UDP-N-acetylmuramate--alanine ligase
VIPRDGRVHFVGVGGAGMSAIAKVLLERGVEVSGSDLKHSRAAAMLEALGAPITIGHRAELVDGCASVVVSSAIPTGNPELQRARALDVPIVTRGQALAQLLEGHRTIVVAGTHGKTTTTSMIVSVLRCAGSDPTYLVGGGLNESGTNAGNGDGELAVAESDESDGSFLLLHPDVAVVTNVEADHLDYWRSLDEIRAAFERWVAAARPGAVVIIPAGDESLAAAAGDAGHAVVSFGRGGDVRGVDAELGASGARFMFQERSGRAEVALRLPGRHNIANALAAGAACRAVGISLEDVARGLSEFRGVERRWQVRGCAGGVTIVDEYAHHPTEVRASLSAARTGAWGRVVAVFQPHRYTRVAALCKEFGTAFSDADRVVVTDVYGAGEQPVPGVTGKRVVDAVSTEHPGRPVAYLPHRDELLEYLARTVRSGDVLLTLGAGDVTAVGEELLGRLGGGDRP